MHRPLTPREHEVALAMIRHAHTSPDEQERATFTEEQRDSWDPPFPISPQQRIAWEANLDAVVVTNPCDCGSCPSIGMRPLARVDDESSDDAGGLGDFESRFILDAGVDGCMLLLFIGDDSPSYLELAPSDEHKVFSEFPPPERIRF